MEQRLFYDFVTGPSVPQLTGEQIALIEALNDRDTRLGPIYLGAVRALLDATNPERVPQAAHSIRELLEKLPRWIDAPVSAGPSLKERTNRLSQDVERAQGSS